MNETVRQIQQEYRENREKLCHCLYDIESSLKGLAKKGVIWVLKDMKDISESEGILIEHYLNKFRSYQIYDHLETYYK